MKGRTLPAVAALALVSLFPSDVSAATCAQAGTDTTVAEDPADPFIDFIVGVEETIYEGDPTFLDDAMDVGMLIEIASEGLDVPDEMKRGIREGMGGNFQIGESIIQSNEEADGTYTFLRMMPGAPGHALFRFAGDDGLEYHELVLALNDDGEVRVADLVTYTMGDSVSSILRRAMLALMADSERGFLDKVLGRGDSEYVESLVKLKRFTDLADVDPEAARKIYAEFPDSVKQLPEIQRLHVQCAAAIGDEAYQSALEEFERWLPDSPALPLVVMDLYIMNEDFSAAQGCLDRIDKAVHGDPYLDIMRSQLHQADGEFEVALQCLDRAVEREEGLDMPAAWERLEIALSTDDFPEIRKQLQWLYRRSDYAFGDVSGEEAFAAFNASKAGERWAKFIARRESGAGDDDSDDD
ncbi:hypothetical protein Poly30_51070 [Planctomycetes bacterium Poly30]|uniref:Tetratricopeptide repeat protein n=1 Tax=Saltatorellus ferox TaxID=2528018 RepID=A0A518EZQ2_9BACT|nr:hypothetical protein Poly30_51070 [Planctomycetes bacterium Poly30]